MLTNTSKENNIKKIIEILDGAESNLKEAFSFSLDSINCKSESEDEILKLWYRYTNNLMNHFMMEAEKSGNKQLVKKVMKYAIFKR